MADLLECVIQIKALADTPRRYDLRVAEARANAGARAGQVEETARDVGRRLCAADEWAQATLEAMLTREAPVIAPLDPSWPAVTRLETLSLADIRALFAPRRRALVSRFERCSATDMARTGQWPDRPHFTVADLAAVVLAHDTDQLGRLRQGDEELPIAHIPRGPHS